MISSVNRLLRQFGLELRKYHPSEYQGIARLETTETSRGSVLVAYIVEPFLLAANEKISQKHTHHIESVTIAESFLKLGYDVDIIDYRNTDFRPKKDYTFFVSARTNFARIANHLNDNCIRIAHLDTAHYLFNNAAAFRRLLDMQARRRATARSMKFIEKNRAPEDADYLAILGNQFTLDTYRYAGKKMFSLTVPSSISFPSPETKNIEFARNRFLWLGSSGFVHKGLDLVLEAFARLPDFHLTVCGPLDTVSEREFRQIYHEELYETDNIDTLGWVDVSSPEFRNTVASCIGLVYPSCSEGQAGSVVTCMRAGLIPIVSYESGIDVGDFGVLLQSCSVAKIMESVSQIASAPESTLTENAIKAWQYACDHHSQCYYSSRYQRMIEKILADRNREG